MQLINRTRFPGSWTMGFARDGREIAFVMAKATYSFDADTGEVRPAPAQEALIRADEFTGAPGLSAVLRETDYAQFKPRCDVLLIGQAHAPAGALVRTLPVGLRVGGMTKAFKVSGDRVWEASLLSCRPSAPEPFTTLPISYDRAFGGLDDFDKEAPVAAYLANPVGRGFHRRKAAALVDGSPFPNNEAMDQAVVQPDGDYAALSFGPMGRQFAARVAFAGTYDEQWQKTQAPFWPEDFRYDYFQAAPADQQIPYPRGGEAVMLKHLTPGGTASFVLPAQTLSVLANFHKGGERVFDMPVDTLVIEPDRGLFTMTSRVGIPMARSIFDLRELVLDTAQALRTRPFRNGKPHYRGLGDLVRARRRGKAVR
ncbi:DUF2169 family type VI secretion system accessory protein [Roseateles depolymerans]|uniref:Uncharacterized protein n=1 Tax=Roseateles depolymerans TaxID=76731 RepID=A0A0U3MHU9_9BURK|nr:DUF2169 domain-containing protein [Roseateles depolymerans]ALV07116.1 hypothetical protein RD2015_2651 [Roseateles depolymerans]REG20099.1 hypothetical protein DES44_2606 [Roseateles depolymerans]